VNYLKRHLSVANVLSAMALFMALGGVTYAATAAKNSVKAKSIAKQAVTTAKLKNGAVTTAKLRNGAVTETKLGDGSVRSSKLGGGVVTTSKLKNGAVTDTKLANNAVTSGKLGADAVTTGKIQDGAVTGVKLASSLNAQLVKNVSYVVKESASDANSPKDATAECPTGKQVTGGGARILGANTNIVLQESVPAPATADNKRMGWTGKGYEAVAEAGNWSIEVYAICGEF
jgi:hypothetical protein